MSDVICALASARGRGGINVIRVSGDNAIEITEKVFLSKKSLGETEGYSVVFGKIIDSQKRVIDNGLVTVFHAPKSFTGENVCEINCHGGTLIPSLIIDALIEQGARLAQKGEFTKRAFLNGKCSLSQAEAIKDVIDSKTENALFVAVNRMEGSISNKINDFRDKILYLMASVSADIDFPDEDEYMDTEPLKKELGEVYFGLLDLLKTAKQGRILQEGAVCAICGVPNTGKSSLLNAILQKNRAIVSSEAGTTRDVIEELVDIDGFLVRLCDLAGIREGSGNIEKEGVKRAKEYIEKADILIFVTEAGREFTEDEKELLEEIKDKDYITVINKIDQKDDKRDFIKISAKNMLGIEKIKEEIKKRLLDFDTNSIIIGNERQKEAIFKATKALENAMETLNNNLPVDLLSPDLENALNLLGETDGMSVSEEIIDRVFKEFCLGK